MVNNYTALSLLSNIIFFISTSKTNDKNLYFIMIIMFTMKIIAIQSLEKYEIDSDIIMMINFIYSMVYARALLKDSQLSFIFF